VDESATGSVNFFWSDSATPQLDPARERLPLVSAIGNSALADFRISAEGLCRIAAMHLRAPSVDPGVHAFGWSVVFFLYMWLGALAIKVPGGIALVVSLVAACGIFLFVRTRGDAASPR